VWSMSFDEFSAEKAGNSFLKKTNLFTFYGAMTMKTFLFTVILSILTLGIVSAQTLDQGLSVNSYLAKDSVITGTKYSKTLILNSKISGDENAFVNYAGGAHILVLARQTHDSVSSAVYLQVGQNLSGTEGKDFGSILVDTLSSTKKVINIDLAPYLDYKQVRLKVVAITGVAVGVLEPDWSAVLGAKGILGKITSSGIKAPTIQ
jgi:hypothetical protein